MDISIYCNNNSFECSYIGWNDIRTDIIKSTELYFTKTYKQNNYKSDSINYIRLTKLFEYINNSNDKYPVSKLLMLFLQDNLYKIALQEFELEGLFYLCFSGDTNGYYKNDESKNICKLLDKVKILLQEIHSNYTYEAIYTTNKMPNECLYNVFKEGEYKQELVIISYKK